MADILNVLKVIDKDGTEHTYNPGGLKCEVQEWTSGSNGGIHTFTKEGAVCYIAENNTYIGTSPNQVKTPRIGGGNTVHTDSIPPNTTVHCIFFGYW